MRVFLTEKHSPDALRGGTGRWPLASGVLSGLAECTGRTRVSLVLTVRCAGVFVTLSAHGSDEHWTVRWLTSGDPASLRNSLRTGPVCTGRVWCGPLERPVFCR